MRTVTVTVTVIGRDGMSLSLEGMVGWRGVDETGEGGDVEYSAR